jgi:hypothetical protein
LMGCFSAAALPDLVSTQALPDLFEKSSVAFSGRATGLHKLPQREGAATVDWSVEFVPLRFYKGPPGASVTVVIRDFNPAWGYPVNPGETVLMFATPVPSIGPGLFNTDQQSWVKFGVPAQGKTETTPTGIDAIEADTVALALSSEDPSLAKSSMEVLTRFPALGSNSVNRLSNHTPLGDTSSEEIRLELLARIDPHRYLSDLAASVSPRDSIDIGGEQLMFHIISDRSGSDDLEVLKSLAGAQSHAVRMAALLGLRRIHDSRTIEFLLGKLQTAGDTEESYEALMGLAETTGRMDLATDMGTFESQPAPRRAAWEAWGKSRGSSTQSPPSR